MHGGIDPRKRGVKSTQLDFTVAEILVDIFFRSGKGSGKASISFTKRDKLLAGKSVALVGLHIEMRIGDKIWNSKVYESWWL